MISSVKKSREVIDLMRYDCFQNRCILLVISRQLGIDLYSIQTVIKECFLRSQKGLQLLSIILSEDLNKMEITKLS